MNTFRTAGTMRMLNFLLLLLWIFSARTTWAVTLAWDASADPTVVGYDVHYGTVSGAYTTTLDVGNVTTKTMANSGFSIGRTYYFAVTAYNAQLLQSVPSNEVSFIPNPANVNLSALAISSGTLAPAFASGTTDYTAAVPYTVASVSVTPTAATPADVTIKVNGLAVTSGAASGAIALVPGLPTAIAVLVLSSDGITSKTYTITVTRAAASSDATLSALTNSSGFAMTPVFASGTTAYSLTVSASTTSFAVTPTASGPGAVIKVGGVTVPSGAASGPIAIPQGQSILNIVVTAQDGTTTQTTVMTLNRRPLPPGNTRITGP